MNKGAEPIIRSKQLSCSCVTVFSPSSLFLEKFGANFSIISSQSHKLARKTYAPENGIFDLLMSFIFVYYASSALKDGAELSLSLEKVL